MLLKVVARLKWLPDSLACATLRCLYAGIIALTIRKREGRSGPASGYYGFLFNNIQILEIGTTT